MPDRSIKVDDLVQIKGEGPVYRVTYCASYSRAGGWFVDLCPVDGEPRRCGWIQVTKVEETGVKETS